MAEIGAARPAGFFEVTVVKTKRPDLSRNLHTYRETTSDVSLKCTDMRGGADTQTANHHCSSYQSLNLIFGLNSEHKSHQNVSAAAVTNMLSVWPKTLIIVSLIPLITSTQVLHSGTILMYFYLT